MAVAPSQLRSVAGLPVALAVCFAASAVGGALTQPNLDWYETLAKPGFAPPNAAFPVVWTMLYAMMAVSAWLVWRAPAESDGRKSGLAWFGLQLGLNVLWSFAFFWLHSPGFGLGVILVLLIAIVITIVLFDRTSRTAALLLIPYVLWVSFAAALNFAVWYLNR
jgi:tryptophan-rich sensory protein